MTVHGAATSARARYWWRVRWIALGVAVVAVGIGAVFGSRLGQDPTLVDSPVIGKPAPTATLPNLEGGGAVSLGDMRGQIVVVNFWASWCVACREEHSALVSAANNYRSAGVVFVGVNYQDQRGAAVGFLDELGRGDPSAYRYVTDPGTKLALEFGVFGVPETFFIDRDGTIVGKIAGPSNYQLLSAALDRILAGREPRSRTEGSVQPAPGQ
ncbi:redoxin [Prauserella sp. PE36]|uniref:TlpA family protein disulfide reductase n=1 Tax=Prauserella sp. PE36 TaxID=1504709 RepID=UPI000DE3BFEF|nr:redoxin domain-containing protein [Prauserella sp. PE36]RBM17439.1 redoxin [Prauserella sp. PE36]